MVLLEWLPEDSAVARALTDGHTWTSVHALLWEIAHRQSVSHHLSAAQVSRGVMKKIKFPKKLRFPWSKPESGTRYGHVRKEDQQAAAQYLLDMFKKTT